MLTLTENDIVDATPRARALHDQRLFTRYHVDGDLAARDALVERFIPLARHLARRYGRDHAHAEDVLQVASIGLLKAIDRYDPTRGIAFTSFATPTILGEIKRYFRDKGWAIRVPRRLQELRMSISAITGEMSQDLGRSPTPRELAEKLGISVEEVMEGLESANAYSTLSLDAEDTNEDGGGNTMLDGLGEDDEGLANVEIRASVKPLIEALPRREKRILLLRFFRGMTQSQIADEIGVSQMHVSRLLNRTLAELRNSLREVS